MLPMLKSLVNDDMMLFADELPVRQILLCHVHYLHSAKTYSSSFASSGRIYIIEAEKLLFSKMEP
jgi:hypothetical protein